MIKQVNSVKFIYKGILEIDEETNIQVLDYFKNSQKKTNLLQGQLKNKVYHFLIFME